MSNAWSHLPNAHHIDWVLASLKENPKSWYEARAAARGAARAAARDAARGAARDAAWSAAKDESWDVAWSAAWDESWDAAWSAAWNAISALVSYDDCDQFLNMPYEKLRV